jgi:hypothetical protein
MKTLILFLTFLAPTTFSAPTPNLATITKALGEGDVATMSTYFDAQIELTLIDKQVVLSKAKAADALRDFFGKNKPKSFTQVHQGSSKGSTSHYTIGDLATASGNYRAYLYYKTTGGSIVIQEIRIEK